MKTLKFSILLSFLLIFTTCKKDNNITPPSPTPITETISGIVNTSEIGGTGLKVLSVYQLDCPVSDSKYKTIVSNKGSQLLFVKDENNNLRALTLSIIKDNKINIMEADAKSTALSLVFMTPGITTSVADSVNKIINKLNILNTFNAFASFLKTNISQNNLKDLLNRDESKKLLLSCIMEYSGIDTTKKKKYLSKESIDPDPYFSATLSGDYSKVELKNNNFRFVQVIRRDLKQNDVEYSVSKVMDVMGGCKSYSLGSIISGTALSPTINNDETFNVIDKNIVKCEYWVSGAGFKKPELTPPFSVNTIQPDLATVIFYDFFPAIDIIAGLGGWKVPMPDLIKDAADIGKCIKDFTNVEVGLSKLLASKDLQSFLSNLTDLTYIVAKESITSGCMEQFLQLGLNSDMLKEAIIPFLSIVMGSSNFIIFGKLIYFDTPHFSKYNIIPLYAPQLMSPENNYNTLTLTPSLSCYPYTAINTIVEYHFEISTNQNFNSNTISDVSNSSMYSIKPNVIYNNKHYYWRVYVKNTTNSTQSPYSEVRSFYTPKTGNQSPNKPTNPSPADGATNQSTSISLSWACTDPDNDPMTYDVYFGTVTTPSKVTASPITSTTYTPTLVNNTKYYWKIVAKDNQNNSTDGDVWNFTTGDDGTVMNIPCPGTPTVTDADGNVYNTVQIGTQCWMKENLNIGTRIDGVNNQTNNSTIEKYCYNNDENNCNIYGGLYQWNEMMQYVTTEKTKGICPTGWHVPSDDEWKLLEFYLGMSPTELNDTLWRGNDEGDKLKEIGTEHWHEPNTGASNSSGFTAIPGAYLTSGIFDNIGYSGCWWSSTNYNAWDAIERVVAYNNYGIFRWHFDKRNGDSVRCVKD